VFVQRNAYQDTTVDELSIESLSESEIPATSVEIIESLVGNPDESFVYKECQDSEDQATFLFSNKR
jgi:hypothetical protein